MDLYENVADQKLRLTLICLESKYHEAVVGANSWERGGNSNIAVQLNIKATAIKECLTIIKNMYGV